MATCNACGKEFEKRSSLKQHFSEKHAKRSSETFTSKKSNSKTIISIIIVGAVLVFGYFIFFNNTPDENPLNTPTNNIDVNLDEVPSQPIHWHPTLTIILKGNRQTIPANLGLSGAGGHKAIHTHDTSGELHMETNNPTAETVTLGYFFSEVYRKTFNSNCIFDLCNGPQGTLTMTVNGQPNSKFDKYVMKNRDNIVIEFSDTPYTPVPEELPGSTTPDPEELPDATASIPEKIPDSPEATTVKEISMTARQWEFLPSTITVNKGDTVKLSITSIDVTHGFALPEFGTNVRLNSGSVTEVEFLADKSGTFPFLCSVQCGAGHGNMKGILIVK